MRRMLKNVVFLLICQGIGMINGLLVVALTARYLGVHRFGTQGVIRATATFALPMLFGGLRANMIKQIGRDAESASTYLGALLALRWLLVLLSAVVMVAIVRLLPLSWEVELASYAAVLIALADVWDTFPRAVFTAYERNQYNVAASIANSVLIVAFTFVAIRLDLGMAGILLANAVATILVAQAQMVVVYRRFVRPRLRIDLPRWREIMKGSLPVGVGGMLKRSYAQVDVWLLAALKGSAAAGIFSVAYRATTQATSTSVTAGVALLPRFSLLARVARDQLRIVFERLLLLSLIVSVPAAVLVAAFAEPLVLAIVGPQFRESVAVLRLVSIVLVTAFPAALLFYCMIALGKETAAMTCLAATVGANVLFDSLLIPHFGPRGACFGTIGGEWTYFLLSLVQIHRALGLPGFWRQLVKPLFAGAAAALVLAWVGPHRPALAAALGLLTFFVLAIMLRAAPRGTMRALRRALTPPAQPQTEAQPEAEEPVDVLA